MARVLERRPDCVPKSRIFLGLILFFAMILQILRNGVTNLDWVPYICIGACYLFYIPREPDGPPRSFLRNPRRLASALLGLVAAVWLWYDFFIGHY